MSNSHSNDRDDDHDDVYQESRRIDKAFKKLKRPEHTSRRSTPPERLRGIHRRRPKRMDW
ncbi:MAG: hypothetical protein CMJ80_04565 [Planctomycetaceae bacterium]|nr:hypothetical protein [Planctomycetaceae bacterium]